MPILGSRGAAAAKGFGLTGRGRRTSATYWLASQGSTNAFRNIVDGGITLTTSYTSIPFRKFTVTGSISSATNYIGAFGGSFQFTALDANFSGSGYTSYACFVQITNSPNTYKDRKSVV